MKRTWNAAAACLFMTATALAQAQTDLDEVLAGNAFVRIRSKVLPAFTAKDLDGNVVTEAFFAERPALALFISGPPPPELRARTVFSPELRLVVFSTDLEADARSRWKGRPDGIVVCPESVRLVKALGLGAPPFWLVSLPGGRQYATRAGTLVPEAMDAFAAAFAHIAASGEAPAASGEPEAVGAPFLSSLEREVLDELNLVRVDPATYAEKLRAYRAQIAGNRWVRPGKTTVILKEGRAAVDEAIQALTRQVPLLSFEASEGMSRAARDLAAEQERDGATGHTGADGRDPAARISRYGTWGRTMGENLAYGGETGTEFVIQLLVDDGVPSRGHRKNILNGAFLVVGIATGRHPEFRTVCVMDFAGTYEESR